MGIKVGLQMYSVRNAMAKDPVGTIGKAAELGYKYVELANLNADKDPGCGFGATAKDLLSAIEPFGAKVVSAHIEPFNKDNVERVLEYHKELGTEYLMSKSIDLTEEAVKRQCDLLEYIGDKCKEYGIKHCLHTGAMPVYADGLNTLDVYCKYTNADALYFELDTYWALRSGLNPIKVIKDYAGRIKLIHQKDLPKNFEKPLNCLSVAPSFDYDGWMKWYVDYFTAEDFAEVGTGVMDIQGIVNAAIKYTDANYIILEQDFTTMDEFDSIKLSYDGFKNIQGIEI